MPARIRVGHWPTFFISLFSFSAPGFRNPGRCFKSGGMDATDRIQKIIAPSVEAMGYEIVRVQVSGTQKPTLQVMAERKDDAAMTVEDCADISRAVSALLDVEDPISSAYTLEISSPGIDRPLTRLKDFERFAGFEARIETRFPLDGRKRFRGILKGVENGAVRIDTDTGPASVPFDAVQRAKLLLTDELIAATAAQQ
ncbi:ribosome maturation factor RimP [Skermanella aerolata]